MLFNFDLSPEIEKFILSNPNTREYDIIRHLQSVNRIPSTALSNSLSMFRCHFLIFNALYRLQLKTHVHQTYSLNISSIKITVTNYVPEYLDNQLQQNQPQQNHPTEHNNNALSHFYLDINHVMKASEQDVNRLLDQFWNSYFNNDQKQNALKVLGLCEPIDFIAIKKQYRRLAMKHHPDRGGDANQLIEVHQAMQCLEMYYV
jgi:curved DNA-binding protein CbpA